MTDTARELHVVPDQEEPDYSPEVRAIIETAAERGHPPYCEEGYLTPEEERARHEALMKYLESSEREAVRRKVDEAMVQMGVNRYGVMQNGRIETYADHGLS